MTNQQSNHFSPPTSYTKHQFANGDISEYSDFQDSEQQLATSWTIVVQQANSMKEESEITKRDCPPDETQTI